MTQNQPIFGFQLLVFKGWILYVPFQDQALRAENDDNPDNPPVFFCGLGGAIFSLHQQFLSP